MLKLEINYHHDEKKFRYKIFLMDGEEVSDYKIGNTKTKQAMMKDVHEFINSIVE